MTPKQLVHAALAGESTPRTPCGPLACHFCGRHYGIPLRDYTLDAATLAGSVIRYQREFQPDAVWVSADTWITAEAMGAGVWFPGGDEPMCGGPEPTVRTIEDVARIPDPDPAKLGREPLMVEALRMVAEAIGDQVFIVGCFDQSPFSLACALGGINEVMVATIEDPPFLEALLEKCAAHAVAYGRALAAAGADMLSTGDSPAVMIGPAVYRRFALPYERRVFAALRESTDCRLSLHICGDSTGLLGDMAASGADVLELDYDVDLAHASAVLPPEIAIWGNINAVSPLFDGTPAAVRQAARHALAAARAAGRSRFVLSSGCTVAPDTPAENLAALIAAAKAGGG
jgi:MtaA/CmuA family methyltransferase